MKKLTIPKFMAIVVVGYLIGKQLAQWVTQ